MGPETDTANTNDWLEASRDTRIRLYIEAYMSTQNVGQGTLHQEGFGDALREIGVRIPVGHAPIVGAQLDAELQAWDALSDEALSNFEQDLD